MMLLYLAVISCGENNPDYDDVWGPIDESFVPFKTIQTEDSGGRWWLTEVVFDSLGRMTSYSSKDKTDDLQRYEIKYSDNGRFVYEQTSRFIIVGRREGLISGGRLKKVEYYEGTASVPYATEEAFYDKVGQLIKTEEKQSEIVIRRLFNWEDGNLTKISIEGIISETGEVFDRAEVIIEYGETENHSGLSALIGAYYDFPLSFFLGTAFTKNVPTKYMEYRDNGQLSWGIEYTDFNTDANGLLISFVTKETYSGTISTSTITY